MVSCKKCGHEQVIIIDSRDHGDYIRRRRKCVKCGFRYTTRELIVEETPEKQPELKDLIKDMDKSIRCLALELPETIHEHVSQTWLVLKKRIEG